MPFQVCRARRLGKSRQGACRFRWPKPLEWAVLHRSLPRQVPRISPFPAASRRGGIDATGAVPRYIRPKMDDSNRTSAEAVVQPHGPKTLQMSERYCRSGARRRPCNHTKHSPEGSCQRTASRRTTAQLGFPSAFPKKCGRADVLDAASSLVRSEDLAREVRCIDRFFLAFPEGMASQSRPRLAQCPLGRSRESFSPPEGEKIPDPIRVLHPRRNGNMPDDTCAARCARRCRGAHRPEGLCNGTERTRKPPEGCFQIIDADTNSFPQDPERSCRSEKACLPELPSGSPKGTRFP
jgi:hypothetical protein